MTLTFRVGKLHQNCGEVSTVDITRFGPSFHRKTTKKSDIISGPIYSKAVTFDL